MEFEFRRDESDTLQASFSMGHEAVASWLLEEVGHRVEEVLPGIYSAIERLLAGECKEYRLDGEEYNLRMSSSEAEVFNAKIDFDADDIPADESDDEPELTDNLNYYDDEARANCGLDDFRDMLVEWERFVSRK